VVFRILPTQFNGDAMGKSLQGAGGALVAGVVIKAILTRTLLYSEYQNRYPEPG
jgi:hypothetical protein